MSTTDNTHAYSPTAKQPLTPFPYPGNKSRLAEWILSNTIDHDKWVAPFAGACGILFNKEPSKHEIINDIDSSVINFYEVLRNRPKELEEFLGTIPYHEQQYTDWKEDWDIGWRPNDKLTHAGVFYYLRRASFGADNTGFRATASGRKNSADQYQNSLERLSQFSDRLENVIFRNTDYTTLIEKHGNDPNTLFYLDPPYKQAIHRYEHADFSPPRFAHWLAKMTGDYNTHWMLSSATVPLPVEPYYTFETDLTHQINQASNRDATVREKITMDYHPDEVTIFTGEDATTNNQATVTDFS